MTLSANEIEKRIADSYELSNHVIEKIPKPIVSVRTSTYNHGSYIRQCIEGVLMQKTNFPFEFIIGEDYSTDETREIVFEYAKKYPDIIRVITADYNVGTKANGRRCIRACRGKYMAICEGDDYWIDPLKLQKQVDFLNKNSDISLVFSNRIILKESSGEQFIQRYKKKYYSSKDLLGGEILGLQTLCCRKEYAHGKEELNGDISIPYNSSLHGNLYCLPDVTAVYRITGKGVATSRNVDEVLTISLRHVWDFHKAYNFPSKNLLIKSQTRYVFNDFVRKIKMRDYTLANTIKIFLSYHNQSLVKKIYAMTMMTCYILFFSVNSLYGKIKQ